MRQLLNRVLSRFSYRITAWPIAKGIVSDSHIAELLARHFCNLVIDVGAHRGETGLRFRRLGFKGRIVSFEPDPANLGAIRSAANSDGNWLVRPFALGDVSEEGVLYAARSSVLSSLHLASRTGKSHFGDAIATMDVPVSVRRLDEFAGELVSGVDEPSAYLKIDTQGHDLAVLRGAANTLRHVRILQMEAAIRPVYEGAPTFPDVYRAAVDAGFALTNIIPGSRDESLAVNEMDAFFVRQENLA